MWIGTNNYQIRLPRAQTSDFEQCLKWLQTCSVYNCIDVYMSVAVNIFRDANLLEENLKFQAMTSTVGLGAKCACSIIFSPWNIYNTENFSKTLDFFFQINPIDWCLINCCTFRPRKGQNIPCFWMVYVKRYQWKIWVIIYLSPHVIKCNLVGLEGMRHPFLGYFFNLRSRTRSKIIVSIFGAILVHFLNINETPINYKFLSVDLASQIQFQY